MAPSAASVLAHKGAAFVDIRHGLQRRDAKSDRALGVIDDAGEWLKLRVEFCFANALDRALEQGLVVIAERFDHRALQPRGSGIRELDAALSGRLGEAIGGAKALGERGVVEGVEQGGDGGDSFGRDIQRGVPEVFTGARQRGEISVRSRCPRRYSAASGVGAPRRDVGEVCSRGLRVDFRKFCGCLA